MRVAVHGVALTALAATALASSSLSATPTRKVAKRHNNFVSTSDGKFHLGGKPFFHISTTAYWLAQLSDDDITTTLTAINATGIKVVRTWAFNDVTEIPPNNGTYFQLLANGTVTINDGPTGLQRLDKVVSEAEKLGLKVQLTLTNNWNALPDTSSASLDFPSGFLSNAYGGMDAYVRHFIGSDGTHEQFFRNETLITAFQNYVTAVVQRYADSPTIFSWEVANDPRCNSTLATAPDCNTHDVTNWVNTISSHIKSIDPNHLVSSGAGGFMCTTCTKLFATATPAAPSASPSAGARKKRAVGSLFTPAKVLSMRTALLKKWREDAKRNPRAGEVKRLIRGRWAAPENRRQLSPDVQGFNGAQGVDSEDIAAIPNVDMSTFQLFPDQNQYMGVDSADVDPVTQAIDAGSAWIKANAMAAANAGKPSVLTAFGLVSTNSSTHFVPFNQSSVTVADILNSAVKTVGANDTQQADAYRQWIQAAMQNGVSGVGQYQWGQTYNMSSTSPIITQSPLAPATGAGNMSLLSPDDGYAAFQDQLKTVLSDGATQQSALNG